MKIARPLLASLLVLAVALSVGGQPPAPDPDLSLSMMPAYEPMTVTVGCEAAYRPMEYIDVETQEIVGFDIDLMRAVCAEVNLQPRFQNLPWDGLFVALDQGAIDVVISSVTITEEREEKFAFSKPYLRSAQAIVIRARDRGTYHNLETLKGRRIGVQLATTGQFLIESKEGYVVRKYESALLALADLRNGNVDGVMIDMPVARHYGRSREGAASDLHVLEESYSEEYYGILVAKKREELLARINAGLKAVEEKGLLDPIKEKWL